MVTTQERQDAIHEDDDVVYLTDFIVVVALVEAPEL